MIGSTKTSNHSIGYIISCNMRCLDPHRYCIHWHTYRSNNGTLHEHEKKSPTLTGSHKTHQNNNTQTFQRSWNINGLDLSSLEVSFKLRQDTCIKNKQWHNLLECKWYLAFSDVWKNELLFFSSCFLFDRFHNWRDRFLTFNWSS